MSNWCTIESDPAVFTELIEQIGVQNIGVEEIYDLNDNELLQQLNPIYGFIFLFRWTTQHDQREALKLYDKDLFFSNQVIQNACATQAILSVLLNTKGIQLGPELTKLKEFGQEMDPKTRGLLIGNSEVIRQVHNSFSRPEPFVFSGERKAKDGDEVYHFISYVPFNGRVYELDGMQPGPILLGEYSNNEEWIQVARSEILNRINRYQEQEFRFTLLSVNESKKSKYVHQLRQTQQHLIETLLKLKDTKGISQEQENFLHKLIQITNYDPFKAGHRNDQMDVEDTLETLQVKLEDLKAQVDTLNYQIEEEHLRMSGWRAENARRKHNYIPFILNLLKILSAKGKLNPLIEQAKLKQKNH